MVHSIKPHQAAAVLRVIKFHYYATVLSFFSFFPPFQVCSHFIQTDSVLFLCARACVCVLPYLVVGIKKYTSGGHRRGSSPHKFLMCSELVTVTQLPLQVKPPYDFWYDSQKGVSHRAAKPLSFHNNLDVRSKGCSKFFKMLCRHRVMCVFRYSFVMIQYLKHKSPCNNTTLL